MVPAYSTVDHHDGPSPEGDDVPLLDLEFFGFLGGRGRDGGVGFLAGDHVNIGAKQSHRTQGIEPGCSKNLWLNVGLCR